MADLVPMRRGSSLARRDRENAQPQPRSDYVASPFAEFDEMWDRMVNRLLGARLVWPDWSQDWTPVVGVEETEDAWVFEVKLPRASRDDLEVEIGDAELIISGEIEEREGVGVVRPRARRSGTFRYRTTLPVGVDPDKVSARFDNGLLTVRVPLPEQTNTRRVTIS